MKTYEEINQKIHDGSAIVLTAEEMIDFVEENGVEYAAKEIDVVTTGTFGMMCSSGAFLNFGHTDPPIKMEKLWLNDVEAYHGNAAVDCYIGATKSASASNFNYGGGHVLEDLLRGRKIHLKATAYATDCYPNTEVETDLNLEDLNQAILCNPRNAYERYTCAVNTSNKTIYTYMGKLLPRLGNGHYSGSGELSPINNDPNYETIGVGTHIFLCGGDGIITGEGTQHNPKNHFGTLMVQGDMKSMSSEFLAGTSLAGYGNTCFIGLGVPIPILNENIAKNCAIKDEDILTTVQDYSNGRLNRPVLANLSYAELKTGTIDVEGKEINVSSISSLSKARKIAQLLKNRIKKGTFALYKPVKPISKSTNFKTMRVAKVSTFVREVMKRPVIVSVKSSLSEIAKTVLEKQVNYAIVTDYDQQLIGFLTTFDLTKHVAQIGQNLEDIMIPRDKIQTISASEPVDLAIRKMQKFKISSLVVIGDQNRVVGLITAEDLIREENRGGI